ncbi:NAD(P)H-dependent oxidoreductase [Belliella sp. DSM 111904]|uniref:NAD(P)H-dependent oxidoreductase n=1 Tax=Belliella filtrata TaxID=2923435 RepID=A0ABS9UWW0_9BACT|nr:NAD(P)H-dependent oxidoreductase [Belliella filtrata]MCH7408435.1 NAD(P)H-dependent oxidoreductase [Belliella filtrata]
MSGSNNFNEISAVFVNCTLEKSPRISHTSRLINVSKGIMEREGVKVEEIRLIDHQIPPGIYPDMTKYGWEIDEWMSIYQKIIVADILILASPIWLGEKSSEAKKLIERLDAMSDKTNEKGQNIYYGKVAGCLITGNEDGIKHSAMGILYSLQHLGFTIPPQADSGWIGEVGPGPSYGDTEYNGEKIFPPKGYDADFTNKMTTFMTYNLLHLSSILKQHGGYPAYGNSNDQWNEGNRWQFKAPF